MGLIDYLWGRHRIRLEMLDPSHAETVARLHQASFARGWDAPEVARMLADATVCADGVFLDDASEPIGFLISRIAADEAEILTICVEAAHRHRGLGRLLIDSQLPQLRLRGVGALFLEVAADNEAALSLYRRLGFAQVGVRPGYYASTPGPAATALVLKVAL